MKKNLMFLCAILLVFGLNSFAGAQGFDMGAGSWIDTSGTASVLQMQATVNPNLDSVMFDLDPGGWESFYFAKIYSTESDVGNDDVLPGSVMAYVDFDMPNEIVNVPGVSIGFKGGFFGSDQGWTLKWSDPVDVAFGNGGLFQVYLEDAKFSSGFWQGPDGADWINAKVKLVSNSVPEPSTMLLLGFGLLGLAGAGRKKFLKK